MSTKMNLEKLAIAVGGEVVTAGGVGGPDRLKKSPDGDGFVKRNTPKADAIALLKKLGFEEDGDNIYVSGKVGRNYNITLTLRDKEVLFDIRTQFNRYGGTISLNDKTTDKIKEVVALYKQLESIKLPKYVLEIQTYLSSGRNRAR